MAASSSTGGASGSPRQAGSPDEGLHMPGDVLTSVLLLLPLQDVTQAMQVCRTWRAAAATPALWQQHTVSLRFGTQRSLFPRHLVGATLHSHHAMTALLASMQQQKQAQHAPLQLRRLVLSGPDALSLPVDPQLLDSLSGLSCLQELRIPHGAPASCSFLQGLTGLRALELHWNRHCSPVDGLPAQLLAQLTDLSLSVSLPPSWASPTGPHQDAALDQVLLPHVQHSSLLTRLQSLDLGTASCRLLLPPLATGLFSLRRLRACVAGAAAPQHLAAIAALPRLQSLDLSDSVWPSGGSPPALQPLSALSALTALSLTACLKPRLGGLHLPALAALQRLDLSLMRGLLDVPDVQAVAGLAHLTHLIMGTTGFRDEQAVAPLAGLAGSLRRLELAGAFFPLAALPHLGHLVNLQTLLLSGAAAELRFATTHLAPLAGLSRLQLLDLGTNRLAPAALACCLPALAPSLRTLQLCTNSLTAQALLHVSAMGQLASLSLSGNKLAAPPAGLCLSRMISLSMLDLRYCGLREEADLQHLSSLSGLRCLDLSCNASLPGAALRWLGPLARSLRSLNLSRTSLPGGALEHVVCLRGSLQILDVSETHMGGEAWPYLVQLTELTHLRVSRTPGTSDSQDVVNVDGSVLTALGQLSKLHSLTVAIKCLGEAAGEFVQQVAGLQALRKLDLTGTDLSSDVYARLPGLMTQLHALTLGRGPGGST